MAKNISFLCSGATGINPDMKLVKKHLLSSDNDYSFRFFSKNTAAPTREETLAIKMQMVDFCAEAQNIICTDTSLPIRDMFNNSYSRVLIAVSYDYIFKNLLTADTKKKSNATNFTHIIFTSPLAEKLFEEAYDINGIECIKGCISPLAEDICRSESIEAVMNKVIRIYPQVKNKKILSVVRTGNKYSAEKFDNFDLGQFLDGLDDDYILVTNAEELLHKAYCLPERQREKMLYIDLLMSANDFLYISDALITNNSYLAGTFAVKGKPLYHLDYCDNYFTEYMKSISRPSFPASSAEIADEICKGSFDTSICNNFSYSVGKSAMAVIKDLLY